MQEGTKLGAAVCTKEGNTVGNELGAAVGTMEGDVVGNEVGAAVGAEEGTTLGVNPLPILGKFFCLMAKQANFFA